MSKFKVGDKIVWKTNLFKEGKEETIIDFDSSGDPILSESGAWYERTIEEFAVIIKNKTNLTNKIMTNIKTFVKNLALSADEKELRKAGLKTDCGEYTQDAIDVVIQELCAEKETKLIEIAKGINAENKEK